MASTNCHAKWMLLRANDRKTFQQLRNRMGNIAQDVINQRRKVLERYRGIQRGTIYRQFRQEQFGDQPQTLGFNE